MSNFPNFGLGSLQSQLPWLILFLLLLDIHWFQGPCSKGTTVNSRLVGCLRLVGRCCGCWWVVLLVASCLCGLSLTNWSLSVYFWEHLHCANNLLIRTPPSFSSGESEDPVPQRQPDLPAQNLGRRCRCARLTLFIFKGSNVMQNLYPAILFWKLLSKTISSATNYISFSIISKMELSMARKLIHWTDPCSV